MKQQINFRASELTSRQLDELIANTGMTQTETVSTAVDRMYREEITMAPKTIKLGTQNDTYTYAVEVDGRYIPMSNQDTKHERPDAKIYYDSGVYPGISDVDQYMCDKASRKR